MKLKSKLLFFLLISSVLLVGCNNVSKQSQLISTKIENENYDEAVDLYKAFVEKNANDNSKISSLNESLTLSYNQSLTTFYDSYNKTKDDSTYQEALNLINNANNLSPKLAKALTLTENDFNTLKDSNTNYTSATDAYSKKDFYTAYSYYKKVDKSDTNYTASLEKINDCTEQYINISTPQLQSLIDSKKYSDAKNICNNILEMLPDNSFAKTKLEEINSKEEKEKQEKKDSLLKKMTVYQDSIDNHIEITPQAFTPMAIGIEKDINIVPELIKLTDYDNYILAVQLGFIQKDWAFTEKIEFNIDGELKYTIDVPYGERKQKIFMGGISEWYIANSLTNSNLPSICNDIANSATTTIRFSGNGRHDHTVSDAEKQYLKDIYDLFIIYTT